MRVMAGPGTGKTYSLMLGLTKLIEQGANPKRIFVCTFTRTAAADLKKAIAKISHFGAADITATTLHAYAFSILSRETVFALTGRVPRPMLEFEQAFMLTDLVGSFGGIRDRERRLRAFGAAWARLQSDEPGWPNDPIDQEFHGQLMSWLVFHNAVLITELVPILLRYFRDNPTAPELTSFDHVLIDEYQDLNKAEQAVLDKLAENGCLIVVGDIDQSIYSFKHANPEGIVDFATTHSDTEDSTLDLCYRCPKSVVKVANALIEHNTAKSPKRLKERPENPAGTIRVVQWTSMEAEAKHLARYINSEIDAGRVAAGEVLVLAPRRQFGYLIRNELVGLGGHAHSFFNEEAFDGNPRLAGDYDAQERFTLLTLLARPDDRVALRAWCGFGSSSLEEPGWRRIRQQCMVTGNSPRDVLEQLRTGALHISHTSGVVARYEALIGQENAASSLKGPALVDFLLPAGPEWSETFRGLLPAEGMDEWTPVELQAFLLQQVVQPELPTDVDYVRVMSLHKSKGLTADLVVIVGCIESLIPSLPRGASPAEEARAREEQRRLFYVALTRARKELVLSSIKRIRRDMAHKMGAIVPWGQGTHAATVASSFIAELGPSLPTAISGSATWPQ